MSSSHRLVSEWLRGNLALLGAVLTGAALRAYQLPGQILVDDEWHALDKSIKSSYSGILTSFGIADHSIPIALYYKLVIDTLGLTEWVIRAPFFLAGTLTILVLPLLLRRHVGRRASNVLAWLLALSPALVYYSRFARPYAMVVLLGSVAVLAFYAWWVEHRPRDAVLYAALATLSGYFTLIALPFVLGPFAFFFVATLLGPATRRASAVRRLIWLGLGTALPLSILLAPPLLTDSQALTVKTGQGTFGWHVVPQVLQAFAGAGGPQLAVGAGVLGGVGWFRVVRKTPQLGALLTLLVVLQVIAVAVVNPRSVQLVSVLGRYLLPALPILLLFAAVGLERLAALAGRLGGLGGRGVSMAVVAGACAFLYFSGPLPKVFYAPNNWTTVVLEKALTNTPNPLRHVRRKLRRVPEFYPSLSRQPRASRVVVEAPGLLGMGRNHLPVYQHIHRQKTLLGFINGLCSKPRPAEVPWGTPGVQLRNFVFLADPDGLRERGVDYVIFHRYLLGEAKKPPRRRRRPDVSRCIAEYRAHFGEPVFSDADIVVFEISSSRSPEPAHRISRLPLSMENPNGL